MLATAGAEEGVGLKPAFQEGAVDVARFLALARAVDAQARQQRNQRHRARGDERVVHEAFHQARLSHWSGRRDGRGRCSRLGRFGGSGCWLRSRCGRRCGGRGYRFSGRCSTRQGWGCGCRGCRCRCRGRSWRRGGCGNAGRSGDPVQIADVLGELRDPGGLVLGLAVTRGLVLGLALHRTLGQREFVRRRGGRALVLDLGLHPAAGAAFWRGRLQGRCRGCQLGTEGVEVLALRNDRLRCLGARHGAGLVRIRNVEHGTGLDAVHITVDESIGIGAQQRDQHLVQRNTGGFVGRGDAPRCVAGLDGDLLRTRAWGRCRHRSGRRRERRCGARRSRWSDRCSGRRGRRHSRRGASWCGVCRAWRGGYLGCGRGTGRRVAQRRRIEQHRVVAHDAPGRPGGLEHEVHERLVHGPVAAQLEKGAAVGTALQCDAKADQGGVVVEAGGSESVRGRRACLQALHLRSVDIRQVDFRAQRLAQSRLHGDAPQGQCSCIRRPKAEQGRCR